MTLSLHVSGSDRKHNADQSWVNYCSMVHLCSLNRDRNPSVTLLRVLLSKEHHINVCYGAVNWRCSTIRLEMNRLPFHYFPALSFQNEGCNDVKVTEQMRLIDSVLIIWIFKKCIHLRRLSSSTSCLSSDCAWVTAVYISGSHHRQGIIHKTFHLQTRGKASFCSCCFRDGRHSSDRMNYTCKVCEVDLLLMLIEAWEETTTVRKGNDIIH